jgi:hypothetical protein
VLVLADEFGRVRFSVRGRTVEIAGDGDRGYRDARTRKDFLLEVAVLRFAVGDAQSPAIVVDYDLDVIGIAERRCRALERRVVELPLR